MMQPVILIINAGSSSIKFALFSAQDTECLFRGQVAGIGSGHKAHFSLLETQHNRCLHSDERTIQNHQQALQLILSNLAEQLTHLHLIAAGHRIVHGGSQLTSPVIIDEDIFKQLQQLIPLAPLHQPHNLIAIEALKTLQPDLIQVACFDTAFHQSQPEVAKRFALPKALYQEGIRHYGFHGLSYQYIARVLPDYSETAATGRTVIAHLGQGCSLCALLNGKSIATTMSFTPLDGLPMGSRCGSIDPAIVLYLMREKNLNADDISDLLHNRSGLLGLSGISADMKTLLDSPHVDAQTAIDVFIYQVCKAVGAMVATLQGLDSLVFTGGIGEHAAVIRQRICQNLHWLGIKLDEGANQQQADNISTPDSSVSVWVIPTNEEQIIAYETIQLALGGNRE